MLGNLSKRILARTPFSWQQEMKRIRYWRQIRTGTFLTEEPEYAILNEFISEGDWVIDVGANVGHYTKKISDMVGDKGRVIALEPVPETFALLADNVRLFKSKNVTLLNVAASDNPGIVFMHIPSFETGLKNYYQACLTKSESNIRVIAISIDSLNILNCIRLVKIDAEGHEYQVLRGMLQIIDRDHPTMIIEAGDTKTTSFLQDRGYEVKQFHGSPNMVFSYLR